MENTLANVDLGRYRRIVQMFWDPEPVNDTASDQPIWCLGRSYQLGGYASPKPEEKDIKSAADTPIEEQQQDNQTKDEQAKDEEVKEGQTKSVPMGANPNGPRTPPESASSSFSSALAYEEPAEAGSWPQGFLDDFESKFWMTYRFDFEPIRKSVDPKATSSLSLPMRLKSQFGADQSGFSSDSGWGCMIRSGQSLLANSIGLLRLGRGMYLCDYRIIKYRLADGNNRLASRQPTKRRTRASAKLCR